MQVLIPVAPPLHSRIMSCSHHSCLSRLRSPRLRRAISTVLALCLSGAVPPAFAVPLPPPPAWWSADGTGIYDTTPYTSNDWAPANIGQLKNVAECAKEYLDTVLAPIGGAGPEITAMCQAFTQADNYAPVTVGQLKNVASPFYNRVAAIGYQWSTRTFTTTPSPIYPWTGTTNPENNAPVNIGQLKNVFSLDLTSFLTLDGDGDSIPSWWEKYYGLSPNVYAPNADTDGDGVPDREEYLVSSFYGAILNPTLTFSSGPNGPSDNATALGIGAIDMDHDGLSNAEDAVPDDALLTFPKAPENKYLLIDLGANTGTAHSINTSGQILRIWKEGAIKKAAVTDIGGSVTTSLAGYQRVVGLSDDGTIVYQNTKSPDVVPDEDWPSFYQWISKKTQGTQGIPGVETYLPEFPLGNLPHPDDPWSYWASWPWVTTGIFSSPSTRVTGAGAVIGVTTDRRKWASSWYGATWDHYAHAAQSGGGFWWNAAASAKTGESCYYWYFDSLILPNFAGSLPAAGNGYDDHVPTQRHWTEWEAVSREGQAVLSEITDGANYTYPSAWRFFSGMDSGTPTSEVVRSDDGNAPGPQALAIFSAGMNPTGNSKGPVILGRGPEGDEFSRVWVRTSDGAAPWKETALRDSLTNNSVISISNFPPTPAKNWDLGGHYASVANARGEFLRENTLWRNGSAHALDTLVSLPAGSSFQASDMNAKGIICGTLSIGSVDHAAILLPVEVAPDVLAVNSNFDEGRIDSSTGYAIPDCDDIPGVDPITGAGNTLMALEAVRDHLDGRITQYQRLTNNLNEGWVGVNPKSLGSDFWDAAKVTIRKIDKIDDATGHPESGQVRFYAKWGDGPSQYRGIPAYDLATLLPVNLVIGGINAVPSESVYGSNSAIPANSKFYIEGVRPGKITLEWRYVKGLTEFKHEQTFTIVTKKSRTEWLKEVYYQIRLQTKAATGTAVDVSTYRSANGFYHNVPNVQAIYYYYRQLFREMPEKFMWAGMAKTAAAPIYAGMSDLTEWYNISEITPGTGFGTRDRGTAQFINGLLLDGQRHIFNDMAWSHRAYQASGIGAIRHAVEAENLDPTISVAWNIIEEGIRDSVQSKINDGNGRLLRREQEIVVQPDYVYVRGVWLRQPPAIAAFYFDATLVPVNAAGLANAGEWLTANSKKNPMNPIAPHAPTFLATVPGGKLDDFADRWAWTSNPTNGMLELWTGSSTAGPNFDAAKRLLHAEKTMYYAALVYCYDVAMLPHE